MSNEPITNTGQVITNTGTSPNSESGQGWDIPLADIPKPPTTFIQAIARIEGFGASPLNRPTRNNNPGDIEWGPFARAYGADRIEVVPVGEIARFAHFPTVEMGWAALEALLRLHYGTLTVAQAIAKYAPPSENDTEAYIREVVKLTGISSNTIVSQVL
jgi:hypothetical protein